MARRKAAGSCGHQHQHAHSNCARMTGDRPEAQEHNHARARVCIWNVPRTSETRRPGGRLEANMALPAKEDPAGKKKKNSTTSRHAPGPRKEARGADGETRGGVGDGESGDRDGGVASSQMRMAADCRGVQLRRCRRAICGASVMLSCAFADRAFARVCPCSPGVRACVRARLLPSFCPCRVPVRACSLRPAAASCPVLGPCILPPPLGVAHAVPRVRVRCVHCRKPHAQCSHRRRREAGAFRRLQTSSTPSSRSNPTGHRRLAPLLPAEAARRQRRSSLQASPRCRSSSSLLPTRRAGA